MKLKILLSGALLILFTNNLWPQAYLTSSNQLIKRILSKRNQAFVTQSIPAVNGKDVFEIESKNEQIVLRGSSGVALEMCQKYRHKMYKT